MPQTRDRPTRASVAQGSKAMFGMQRRLSPQDLVAELRSIRETQRPARFDFQVIAGAKFVAPDFLFVRPEPIIEEEVHEKAQSLLAEWGVRL